MPLTGAAGRSPGSPLGSGQRHEALQGLAPEHAAAAPGALDEAMSSCPRAASARGAPSAARCAWCSPRAPRCRGPGATGPRRRRASCSAPDSGPAHPRRCAPRAGAACPACRAAATRSRSPRWCRWGPPAARQDADVPSPGARRRGSAPRPPS